MKIKIKFQQSGKKIPRMETGRITIDEPDGQMTIKELIRMIVTQQVQNYNQQSQGPDLVSCLSSDAITNSLVTGKVTFGKRADMPLQDTQKAVEVALTSFEDGIYCIFIDGNRHDLLEDRVTLSRETEVSFVRLTLLTGRYY